MSNERRSNLPDSPGGDPKPLTLRDVGVVCRCVPCCCRTGQGHKHPAYERLYDEWEAAGHPNLWP